MTAIFGILGVIFVILKLTGAITWSWWWVCAPFIFNASGSSSSITLPTDAEAEEIKSILKNKLSPYKLYNDKFRAWVVGYCSY